MKKTGVVACALAGVLALTSCSSSTNEEILGGADGLTVNGKSVYLRGEMNDYAVSETYRLRKDKLGFCTLASLRSDWAPYKFKFADANWSKNSNFGFKSQPGVLRPGSNPIELNPNSRFDEIKYYPTKDGVYKFCLLIEDDRYYVQVYETDERQASRSLLQIIRGDK